MTVTNQQAVRTAHASSTKVSLPDQVKFLKEHLGTKLLALTVGVSPKTIDRWDKGQNTIGPEQERKIRAAFQVFQLLKSVEASPTIRAWFMGMNPQLDDLSPAEAIADGQLREVLAAARAFLSGG